MEEQQQQQAKDRNRAKQASFPRKNQALSAMCRRESIGKKGNNKFSGKRDNSN
jgi:hypothetical protein